MRKYQSRTSLFQQANVKTPWKIYCLAIEYIAFHWYTLHLKIKHLQIVSAMQGCNESLKFWVESSQFGLILGFESSRVMYKFQWERVTEYCSSHW